MSDLESAKPLFESSVKLCAAVKKYKCLHDQESLRKDARPECEDAWKFVANECNETVEFCKKRWRTLRRCFYDGLKRRGNKYYLHDHLKFLVEQRGKKVNRKSATEADDAANSTIIDALQKSLQEREMRSINTYDDDMKSVSSQTTSADESNENIQQANQNGIFIINEIEEPFETEFVDERRLSFKRSCKRALDPELIDELTEEEPEEKRSRKSDKLNSPPQFSIKPIKVRMDKLKINLAEKRVESVKCKMIDRSTYTDLKQTREFGTQYEFSSSDFDDIFMNSIACQLKEMNARQKMNFKRKMYQSLLDVFDDAADFPSGNEILPLPPKQAPCVVNTTTGELRLMRELVSLVQAAKNTPEIMNANKEKSSTPLKNTAPVKTSLPTINNPSKAQGSSISPSPSLDDDDLQFFIDNIDDEDDISLPRSWDEIKAKPTETNKNVSDDNVPTLSRRLLQKVVRVSGPNGSTIVTRDGEKKRIYRIVPKLTNASNGNHVTPSRSDNSSGTFIAPSMKPHQDTRKDNAVGTFYVSSTKNSQDVAKVNNSVANNSMRTLNNKPTNNTNQTSNFAKTGSQNAISNTVGNAINSQTMFKNVHPANRILSPTTGYFKMVPTTKPVKPLYVPKASVVPSATTNSTFSPVMGARLPVRPMMPTTKRVQAVRQTPLIMQRRYSICGSLAGEKPNTNSPNSATTTAAKTLIFSNSSNKQIQSSVSQIQISQPISLNTKVTNPQTASTKDIKPQTQTRQAPQTAIANNHQVTSAINGDVSTTATSKQHEEIPRLQTAGTVEADDLDPLIVKPLEIKSEPVDE